MPRYTPADRARFIDIAFDRLSAGETLDQICGGPNAWPSRPTLRAWLRADRMRAGLFAAARRNRDLRPRHPFDPAAAEELLRRLRWGEPLSALIREAHLPHRRALDAWRAADPAFDTKLAAAKAFADPDRRRARRRRAGRPYDEPTADRIMLAVMRGATLPDLARDPSLPSALGLRRWRRADPVFDAALKAAMQTGHRARGRRRAGALADARCTPALTQAIELEIVNGASLHSLGARPDMPSPHALYAWVRDRPAFAAAVAEASEFRDEYLYRDTAYDLDVRLGPAGAKQAGALRKRLGQLNPHPGQRKREREGRRQDPKR